MPKGTSKKVLKHWWFLLPFFGHVASSSFRRLDLSTGRAREPPRAAAAAPVRAVKTGRGDASQRVTGGTFVEWQE